MWLALTFLKVVAVAVAVVEFAMIVVMIVVVVGVAVAVMVVVVERQVRLEVKWVLLQHALGNQVGVLVGMKQWVELLV